MSKWINVKDQKPSPKEKILTFGKCGMIHAPQFDYDEFCHTEYCSDEFPGSHSPGGTIEFDYWMPVPENPNEMD